MVRLKTSLPLMGLLISLVLSGFVNAQDLPTGKVILTISGKIARHNTSDGRFQFDMDMLDELAQYEFVTHTPWSKGANSYMGPKMSDVLKYVQADQQSELILVALNDYHADFQWSLAGDAILATRENGKKMRVRKKGPIWVVVPFDERPELNKPRIHAQLVWQLTSIEVR